MITTIIDEQKLTVSGDWGFLAGFLGPRPGGLQATATGTGDKGPGQPQPPDRNAQLTWCWHRTPWGTSAKFCEGPWQTSVQSLPFCIGAHLTDDHAILGQSITPLVYSLRCSCDTVHPVKWSRYPACGRGRFPGYCTPPCLHFLVACPKVCARRTCCDGLRVVKIVESFF